MDFKQIRKQDSQYAGGGYAEKRAQDCGQGTFVRAVYKKDDNGSEDSRDGNARPDRGTALQIAGNKNLPYH